MAAITESKGFAHLPRYKHVKIKQLNTLISDSTRIRQLIQQGGIAPSKEGC